MYNDSTLFLRTFATLEPWGILNNQTFLISWVVLLFLFVRNLNSCRDILFKIKPKSAYRRSSLNLVRCPKNEYNTPLFHHRDKLWRVVFPGILCIYAFSWCRYGEIGFDRDTVNSQICCMLLSLLFVFIEKAKKPTPKQQCLCETLHVCGLNLQRKRTLISSCHDAKFGNKHSLCFNCRKHHLQTMIRAELLLN